MDKFKIKPRTGVTVLDPDTRKPLATEGEDKPRNKYWLRRVADGDVIVIEDKPKTKSK